VILDTASPACGSSTIVAVPGVTGIGPVHAPTATWSPGGLLKALPDKVKLQTVPLGTGLVAADALQIST
jgi:hypothetical protein